ncbi:MAG TPA: hypothetical protein VNF47_23220 [Streptosporangiaceae bacterium]|nr:hypothetical protein [Streptosporangiaceae bacterium]
MHPTSPAQAWAWLLATGHGTVMPVLALVTAFLAWHRVRKTSLARLLRSVSIPLVLIWEAQGLYGVALRVGAARDLAWVLAGVTSALILTFAAFADEHYRKHGSLGPNGRLMWYVAVPMGLVVALNASSPAGVALRLILPVLSVLAYTAAYLPDEPGGRRSGRDRSGSWRWTPRRIAVAAGLIDPTDADLLTVHAERRVRQLTRHANGVHRGTRLFRRWHGWRLDRLMLLATDAMVTEAGRRVNRVHHGRALTAPKAGHDPYGLAPHLESAPGADRVPVPEGAPVSLSLPAPEPHPANTPGLNGCAPGNAPEVHPESAPGEHPESAPGLSGRAHPERTRSANRNRTRSAPRERTRTRTRTRSAPVTAEDAEAEFMADLASGAVPSLRAIRSRLHVGQDRASQIQSHLAAVSAARD